jgi:hypothetical protein
LKTGAACNRDLNFSATSSDEGYMLEATILLALLGVALRVLVARGKNTMARQTFISLSPELKPAKKISRKHLP